ncbi:MAG: TolC family protein [Saprospiraceae bacterium]|nr:TolC family protein [Saprospiraceae bacterium]
MPDTGLLDWPAFRTMVMENHPLARQAGLFENQASAALLRARGGFDPKLYTDFENKEFAGKNYFSHTEAGVKVPTGFGLQLKGSYNWASGTYLNPEMTLPEIGQAALGVEWSVFNGFFLDERRSGLQMAEIGLDQGTAERDILNNLLLLEGAKVYWNWVLTLNQLMIFEEALRQANIRNVGIREQYLNGANPAIDTLESYIQVQNREMDINFARVDLQNARLMMTNFVWRDDQTSINPELLGAPPDLIQGAYGKLSDQELETLRNTGRTSHPELRLYEAKLRILEVERRLKNAKRMPVLDVNYNILGNGWEFFPYTSPNDGLAVMATDIKWGINFSYPLLNRKARGDLQITDVKIAQTGQTVLQKRQEIDNKILQYANELNTLSNQIVLYRDITTNYRILLDGEMEKFRLGESTVFLINTREQRWIDAQIKFLKLLSEYRKTKAALYASAGVMATME